MEKNLRIALIDLECTCDEITSPLISGHEIIEIGLVIGDLSADNLRTVDSLQLYVRPLNNPKLTAFCTQLTGIEQTIIDKANPLVDALLELASWLKKAQVNAWGSWGMFDRSQFIMECRLKNLENPLANLQHFNIKQLFARKFDHRVGLVRAVTMRGLTFEGRAHSGISDATNIARLLAKEHLLREAVLQRVSCERFCHE